MQVVSRMWRAGGIQRVGLVVVIGVLACCAFGAIGNILDPEGAKRRADARTATAQVAAVMAATEAARPTNTPAPEATLTRKPTRTPNPKPTTPPKATDGPVIPSLGIRSDGVQSTYEKLGFSFKSAPLQNGNPRVLGTSPNKLATVELIGTDDALWKATVIVAATDKPADNQKSVLYLFTLLSEIVPGWTEGPDWASENMSALSSEINDDNPSLERVTTVEDRNVKLSVIDIGGAKMIFLAIEPVS